MTEEGTRAMVPSQRAQGTLWAELCPSKGQADILAPGTVTVTLFGNTVFADVIKERRGCWDWGEP